MVYILLFFTVLLLPLVSFIIYPLRLNTRPAVIKQSSSTHYRVLDRQVYFCDDESGECTLLAATSPRTFQPLAVEKSCRQFCLHGRDHQFVYFRDQVIEQADPAAFRVVDVNLGKDSTGVYKNGKLLSSDPRNFKYLGGDLWKDSVNVYCGDRVISSQASTFRFLATVDTDMFFKDAHRVFINGNPVIVKDPASFEYMGRSLFRDDFYYYQFKDGVSTQIAVEALETVEA